MTADVLPQPDPASKGEPGSAPKSVPAPAGDVKELRLGLVCYGGVSLAIYMHGITKEIHRAIRASVLEEHDLPSDEEAASEHAYRELLEAMRAERDVHTRIVVDTIAGSSAGGINGIFLAKALAHDLNQDGLRDLWFEHGDLEKIIHEPHGLAQHLAKPLIDAIVHGDDSDVPSEDAKQKLILAGLRIYAEPLLEGDEMSRRIYEALAGMEPGDGAPASEPQSLMPPRHPLGLSVTVTDYYGYARHLPIADPPVVAEAQHRHLLEFRYRSDQGSDFTAKQNGALTLAARATSSLPVGFQPVHVGTFPDVLPQGATTYEAIDHFFRAYHLAGAEPRLDPPHRRRRARQQAVRSRAPRDQAAPRGDRGRPLSLLPRTGPEGSRGGGRGAEDSKADPGDAGSAERPSPQRADSRRAERRPRHERARPGRAGRDRGQLGADRSHRGRARARPRRPARRSRRPAAEELGRGDPREGEVTRAARLPDVRPAEGLVGDRHLRGRRLSRLRLHRRLEPGLSRARDRAGLGTEPEASSSTRAARPPSSSTSSATSTSTTRSAGCTS